MANIVTVTAPSTAAIFAARMAHGCASGIFMWLLIGVSIRSTLPARIKGIYFAVQGGVSLVMAALFGSVVLPRFGANGAFVTLAVFSVIAALGALSLPRVLDPPRGWVALLSIMVCQSAVLAMWVHFPPLAEQLGYPDWVKKVSVPFAIGMETAAGVFAAALAARLGWLRTLQTSILALIGLAIVLSLVHSPLIYVAVVGTVGFLWMITAAFQFPFALAMDPSRRTMAFVSPVQLVGAGLGPAIAWLGVIDGDVRGAMMVASGLFVVSLLLMTVLAMRTRRGAATYAQ